MHTKLNRRRRTLELQSIHGPLAGVACGLSGIDTRNDAKIKKQVLRNFMQQLNVPDHVRLRLPCIDTYTSFAPRSGTIAGSMVATSQYIAGALLGVQ